MQLKVLGSSSKGNCYVMTNGSETLIIECGVNISDIKRAIGFSFASVAGVLLTHEHNDHAKSAHEVMAAGLTLYASAGTIRAIDAGTNHRAQVMTHGKLQSIGLFSVLPFKVEHDCAEPFGFMIHHPDCGNILFLTDTYFVRDTFKGLSHILIEANYCMNMVRQRMADGYMPDARAKRLMKSHMNLETCIKTLRANDLSQVRSITLIHLSDGNSNAEYFQKSVTAATGKPVTIADAGVVIDLSKKPF